MHQKVRALNAGFRAHIKSHKTIEGTRLQLKGFEGDGRIICSTLKEIEHIEPLIKDGTVSSVSDIPTPESRLEKENKTHASRRSSMAFLQPHRT